MCINVGIASMFVTNTEVNNAIHGLTNSDDQNSILIVIASFLCKAFVGYWTHSNLAGVMFPEYMRILPLLFLTDLSIGWHWRIGCLNHNPEV